MKRFILSLGLLAALAFGASAQSQYGVITTLVDKQGTNVAGATTNVAAAVGLAKWDGFALSVVVGLTNASTGSLDIRWSTSQDGVTYTTGLANPGSSGWFAVPLTNAGTATYWTTNIAINNIGYWRIDWITNNAVQHTTNYVIKAYVKPKRQG